MYTPSKEAEAFVEYAPFTYEKPLLIVCFSIVFVHGLGGDSFSTWTDDDSKTMWPSQLLPKAPRFANARIMTFGYNADAFLTIGKTKSNERLSSFGEKLLNLLNDARIEEHQIDRPLVLVGHSLGGIVIKSVIIVLLAICASSDFVRLLFLLKHDQRCTNTLSTQ